MRPRAAASQAYDVTLQDRLIEACRRFSGVALPT
jgi:hypothetical protein